MKHRHFSKLRAVRQQSGVVLIMCLVMMVLMTIVGMAGIRVISTQERMVGQAFDRTLSFQAAESALREVEQNIEAAGRPEPTTSACSQAGNPTTIMVCGLITTTVPRWQSTSISWASASTVGTGNFAIPTQYFVEYLGDKFPCSLNSAEPDKCLRYRVTARANPGSERSAVMLQSIYATYKPSAP
jgi:type IV pilus assembly protein PilX